LEDGLSNADRLALRDAYDRQATEYGRVRNPKFDRLRDEVMDFFATEALSVGSDVLDLGAGPGHESVLLRERGLVPLAIDFAPRMIELCRERGIDGRVMDLTDLDLPANRYAGAWMAFSLLHLPKADAGAVVEVIHRALVPGGILMILLFEGDGEGPRAQDLARFGVARYFSYYRSDELKALMARKFDVIADRRFDLSPRPTLVVAGRKPR
jgi:SAM-dependent methyltransferase